MTVLAVPRVDPASVPVSDGRCFPVRRVFCVGRNYADHAAEMGAEVDREAPFYFTKSAHSVLLTGQDMPYPPRTNDLHHEVELFVAIGAEAKDVSIEHAEDAIFGYGCGLDMTRRDLQAKAKAKARPWDTGKDFENAAILGAITPVKDVGDITQMSLRLSVNCSLRQNGMIRDMVWSVPEIIADLSGLYHLQPGDLIMTGTPAGVGPVGPGDVLSGSIGDFGTVETRIT